MANFVTLSAIGAKEADFSSLPKDYTIYEKEIKAKLKRQIDEILPNNPDLIVFPECANRYAPNTRTEIKEFYKYLGESIVDFLKPIAVDNNTNIAYSAQRYAEPSESKPFRNSTIYINRNGEICGVYNKNHLIVEEYTQTDVAYGTEAQVVNLDFGKAASVICFDLNFDELLYKYKPQSPDLIVFSSMFHGGLMRQAQWAYTCRSYFVGAVCDCPCYILNPYGDIIAASTNYTRHTSATVNLDYAICHLDYNWDKIADAKNKYKEALTVYDPGFVGSVMLTCEDTDMKVWDIISEFNIEPLDVYLDRVRAHRLENL